LNPYSPLRSGISIDQLSNALRSLASKAALSPAVLLLPAATVVASRFTPGGRARGGWAGAVTIAALLAAAPMIVQGEPYYPYHLAALPVLAAGLCGYAAGRWAERGALPVAVPITLAATAAAGAWLMTNSNHWRLANLDLLVEVLLGVAALLAVLAALFLIVPTGPSSDGSPAANATGVPTHRRRLAGVVVAAGFAILPVLPPATAWSLAHRSRCSRYCPGTSRWSGVCTTAAAPRSWRLASWPAPGGAEALFRDPASAGGSARHRGSGSPRSFAGHAPAPNLQPAASLAYAHLLPAYRRLPCPRGESPDSPGRRRRCRRDRPAALGVLPGGTPAHRAVRRLHAADGLGAAAVPGKRPLGDLGRGRSRCGTAADRHRIPAADRQGPAAVSPPSSLGLHHQRLRRCGMA